METYYYIIDALSLLNEAKDGVREENTLSDITIKNYENRISHIIGMIADLEKDLKNEIGDLLP
ncbi:hypothetical protein BSK59_13125 [Paenibacillus odorifer]|uniref:hypothetical protein n=1 Tax=Paenibacillus odorifer TaxID=189426 RepID=UPI00096FC324|nr:hypothetical protein [Paenibacillus odorifer]OME55415.1 hypothetical protein BSK59_13125 [Paenibacillus odorifer]